MKRIFVVATIVIAASVILAGIVLGAQYACFLKIDGIQGDSNDAKHKGEIDIMTWSWGETNSVSQAVGMGAGRPQFQDVRFTAGAGSPSVKLFRASVTGMHLPKAILTCRKSGGRQDEFSKVTFSDLVVSSYVTSGSFASNDTLPIDSFSFNFGKVEFQYTPTTPDGHLLPGDKAIWNLKSMKLE